MGDAKKGTTYPTTVTKQSTVAYKVAAAGTLIDCVFKCLKHTKMDLSGRAWVPVHSCSVYLFYAKGEGKGRVYLDERDTFKKNKKEGKAFATLDESGKLDIKLAKGATYYCYFAGRELTKQELTELKGGRSALLIRVMAAEEIKINQSFFWWIALLQRVEEKIGADALEVLTKVRKLYYDGGNWNRLITRERIEPIRELQGETLSWRPGWSDSKDQRVVNALARRYEGRDIKDRHDYVVLPDEQNSQAQSKDIQIGHVLTGLEAGYYGTAFSEWGVELNFPLSAATWGGDLGQAMVEAIRAKDDGHYLDPYDREVAVSETDRTKSLVDLWPRVRDAKARAVEMLGDIHGYYLGSMKQLGSTRLSTLLEAHFCVDPNTAKKVAKSVAALSASAKEAQIHDFYCAWYKDKFGYLSSPEQWFTGKGEKGVLGKPLQEKVVEDLDYFAQNQKYP